MKFNFISLAAVALILISCSLTEYDVDELETSQANEIVGMWDWVESIHGWTGRPVLPDSVGYIQQLNFFDDGSFSYFRADTLVKSGTYTLRKQDDHLVLSYDIEDRKLYPDQRVTFKTNDLIEIIYLCMDCPSSTYERLK